MDEEFVNSKYFFQGKLENSDEKLYGLYSPACNCFLLLSSELEVLELLTYLMFNRMKLIVIRIDAAPNYTPTIIDNLCSTNWTMSNFNDVKMLNMPGRYNNIYYENLGKLIECSFTVNQDGELVECTRLTPDQTLIEIMFFAHYVIKWYKTEPSFFYSKVYDLIDLPFPDKFTKLKEIEKNCYRLIYTCYDYRDIEDRVLQTLVKEYFQ